jgi:hypothetical protein
MKNLPTKLFLCAMLCAGILSHRAFAQGLLYSDTFDTDTSANWTVFEGSGNFTPDYTAEFAFDYSTNQFVRNGVTGTIPPAPNGGGKGLKLTVNNNDETAATSGVSLYPTGQSFADNYALRVDMWLNYNGPEFGGSGSTEFAHFGINTVGDKVNWVEGPVADGVWFAVTGEGGAARDYRAYVGDGSSPALELDAANAGFLDRDGDGTVEFDIFIDNSQPPTYPLKLMLPKPEFETAGMPSKQWVQLEVRQRTNEFGSHTVTWLINGYVISEHAIGAQLGMTAGNVMLGAMDIFASIANPRAQNFVIYDNLRVVDLDDVPPPPEISASGTVTNAAEPATDGIITIARTGDTAGPAVVSFRLGGTATRGVDYATQTNSVTFTVDSVVIPAGAASVNVTIKVLDDGLGEPLEDVILVLVGNPGVYDIREGISATVYIEDDGDVPIVTVNTLKTNAYELNPNNEGRLNIVMSNPSLTPTTIGYALGGTAVAGVDYSSVPASATIPAGETNVVVRIRPINNNLQDGNRDVTLTVTSGAGYTLGTTFTGTVTIRDDDLPAGTLAFTANFDTDQTANWTVNASPDGEHGADVFFDYSTVGIPPAPNSTGGTTRGLRLAANTNSFNPAFGGISVSPTGQSFPGDSRVRFDAWLNYNGPLPAGGSGSTQGTGAGVGTAGNTPQWAGGTQDSLWFGVTAEGGSGVDYRAYSSAAGTGYLDDSGIFAAGSGTGVRNNTHPYYAEFGREAAPEAQLALYPEQTGLTSVGVPGMLWRDMVITKQGNTVTWHMDGKLIATVSTADFVLGGDNILFNHFDINTTATTDFNGPALLFGLIDNVRVETLATVALPPDINNIQLINGRSEVQIDFAGETADTPASFVLQASGTVQSGYNDVTANITQLAPGSFRAVRAVSGSQQFYRLRRQ